MPADSRPPGGITFGSSFKQCSAHNSSNGPLSIQARSASKGIRSALSRTAPARSLPHVAASFQLVRGPARARITLPAVSGSTTSMETRPLTSWGNGIQKYTSSSGGAPSVSRPLFRITLHAAAEMQRRSIVEEDVLDVLVSPGQVEPVRPGREVWQSLLQSGFLLRVFIDIDRTPMEVVTVYRTSKIDKYWRVE